MVEMMMAIVISVVVFAALGTLLTRCFSMWLEAEAQWKLAQHARVARIRLLNGGFGVGTGLLSASNVTTSAYSSWTKVSFEPVGAATYEVYGWPGSEQMHLWMKNPDEDWAWATIVGSHDAGSAPDVYVNHFKAQVTNDIVRLSYTLNFSAIGRNFELPQVVEAHLVNRD